MVYIKRWLALLALFIVLLSLIFAVLVYTNILANNLVVIKLRNIILDKIESKSKIDTFYYSLRPIEIVSILNRKMYKYKMVGKLKSVDYHSNLIVLVDKDDEEWNFEFSIQQTPTGRGIIYTRQLIDSSGKVQNSENFYMDVDDSRINQVSEPFTPNDIMAVFWADERSVGDLKRLRSSGDVVRLRLAGVIPFLVAKPIVEEER